MYLELKPNFALVGSGPFYMDPFTKPLLHGPGPFYICVDPFTLAWTLLHGAGPFCIFFNLLVLVVYPVSFNTVTVCTLHKTDIISPDTSPVRD